MSGVIGEEAKDTVNKICVHNPALVLENLSPCQFLS